MRVRVLQFIGVLLCGIVMAGVARGQTTAPRGVTTRIAANDVALLPIVVGEKAGDEVKQHARTLADMLGQISGAKFTVQTGDGATGIAVGTPTDFAKPPVQAPFDARKDLYQREDYLLRSHAKGLYVIGATDLAVRHAVWKLLYRLGYRQFFPGKTWEVVPSARNLAITIDLLEHPDYFSRLIWYQWGSANSEEYKDWCVKNRVAQGVTIMNQHFYNHFVDENKAEFAAHPEYYGLVNGERKSYKFCISNPELRKLVARTAVRFFEKYPNRDSISLEPTDGSGWCECEHCKPIAISDRVVMLANEAAEAIAQRYGKEKFVGIFAYWQHCLPPSITLHPQINVCVANGLMASNEYNVFELLERWGAKANSTGVYEYFSVNTWWRDMPGRPTGANLKFIQTNIPRYHQLGARVYSAESGDNWGVNGLGYYFASRVLWDVKEAKLKDAIVADFLDKAFKEAKKPMTDFYTLIDGSYKDDQMDDMVGKMYRYLAEARALAKDPKVIARINDLILYTRYVELFKTFAPAKGEARQQAFETMMRFAYRIHKTGMVHTVALAQDLPANDKNVTMPKECTWFVPEGKNPWKSSEPFSEAEMKTILDDGVKNNRVLRFSVARYSTNLAPAAALKLPDVPTGNLQIYPFAGSAGQTYYTIIPQGQTEITLHASGDKRRIRLYAADDDAPLATITLDKPLPVLVMPEGKEFEITLKAKEAGLHRLNVEGGGGATQLAWEDGTPMTINANRSRFNYGYSTLYFYVPKGTKEVIGKCDNLVGSVADGDGKTVFTFKDLKEPGYFAIPVPAGQDGKLWKLDKISGHRWLYTVPPYLARNAKELLLPKEVIEKDATK